LQLSDSYCMPVLQYCLGAITFSKSHRQLIDKKELKCLFECGIYCRVFAFHKWESVGCGTCMPLYEFRFFSLPGVGQIPCLRAPMRMADLTFRFWTAFWYMSMSLPVGLCWMNVRLHDSTLVACTQAQAYTTWHFSHTVGPLHAHMMNDEWSTRAVCRLVHRFMREMCTILWKIFCTVMPHNYLAFSLRFRSPPPLFNTTFVVDFSSILTRMSS